MAVVVQLGGYGAETKDEKADREFRERTYGKTPTSEPKPKEKR